MKLAELKKGNAFEFFPTVGGEGKLGLKCRGVGVPETVPYVPVVEYEVMDPLARVIPIGKIEDFDSGIGIFSIKGRRDMPLEEVPAGMVIQTVGGLIQMLLATEAITISGRVVAVLDFPNALPFDTEVNDLGYAGAYSRLPE